MALPALWALDVVLAALWALDVVLATASQTAM